MNKPKLRWIILVAGILAVLAATPTHAAEAHFYAATHGLRASFYPIGGHCDIDVYARRTVLGLMIPNHAAV